ncbi:heterokaryon incompatibility protein-domain-containing protein, partial [Lophiotrema nucula]
MSSQDVPAYSYQPLARSTSIRILVLKPSLSFEDPLEAKLMHADRSIDDEPTSDKEMRNIFSDLRYEAVSYCWGKADFTHTLICDGKWLGITANVNSMLRHLRKPSKPRHLWVDALCLNQTDMQEKAVQVQLMGDIYKQAHKVQIWLGENDEDDYILEVYGLLKALAVTSNAVFLTQRREEMRNLFKKAMEPAFDRFVARPWFSRKWILQEVYHGKSITIRCGRTKIPWFWVRDGICAIEEIMRRVGGSFLTSHTKTMRHIWGLQKLSSQPSSIMDLLYEFSGTECSDQRDRLYALFNMAIDMSVEDISVYDSVICAYGSSRVNKKIYFPVNYSNHWVDVYTDFARACLSPGRELNFLQHMVMFG